MNFNREILNNPVPKFLQKNKSESWNAQRNLFMARILQQ